MSDNIKVVVKVRPLISREIAEKLSYQWRVKNNTLYQLDQNGKDLGQSFTFDKVYDKDTKTSDVYNDIAKPIVHAATAGFNGTIFAYGQTSSGKTYTMTGTESSPGIIPLAVLNLFEIIKSVPDRDFLVRVSYIEIYNETVKDLLNVEKENVKVHETLQGIKVDASEKVTSSPEEVLEIMKEGEANRQMGATNMNEQSSRSHSIFQITIESREHTEGENEGGCVNVSQLNLVDLAGSERAGQTGATGIRFKEGTHINKSLSSLALVIKQLSEDPNKYANYRDSKLTRILQNSLGGNAKTSIICAVTPAAVEETISTLQFANRAKAIKNKPEVNAVATDATMIQRLTKQMSKLQAQLESKKNLEQDNYNLQKQINALQRLILNGFAQRRSIDLMQGTRRKLQQPRRVTIHSTVSTIEDEPVINIPKFCTPSLKYNPLSIPNPAEFVPIQSSNKLASVPEEPARLITPPPRRAVNFNDEVIELDSDDDSVHGDLETCSPIHKCYGASKTPPCILRKNAKLAEKNLRDIVELTEREKIYSPSTVELMEKLEQNSTVIAKLQDEIEVINKQSKEKNIEVDVLKSKLKKNEEELKTLCSAKADLQAQCDNYSTKLTDWEVSYETLRNKARLREEELLSLLEEFKVKQPKDIGKLSRTFEKEMQFMDMSKDISLVNSDNENSIVNPDDINNIVLDTSAQLASKNQNVVELEANLFAHKQKIASLESLSQELEQSITTFKEKITNMETENSLLKTTIDTLNTTINNQKDSLQSANDDITSYNHVIQELQIKLTQKESILKLDINDSVIEKMIANEQQVIANNENIVNIIQCFKNALDIRNKEIAELKNKVDNDLAPDNKDVLDELRTKTEHIQKINVEVGELKKQINENITLINKLMHEKNDYKILEQELSTKLADIENKNRELEKIKHDNALCIEQLKAKIDKQTSEISDKNNDLTKQIEELTNKIGNLEIICNQKDDLIASLNKDKTESEENMLKAKTAVLKSQTIIATLSGNMQEFPEIINNFVNIFCALSDSLDTLETAASDIVLEKEEATKLHKELKTELYQIQSKYNSEVTTLQEQIENLSKAKNGYKQENNVLTETINQLNSEVQTLREELYNKTSVNSALEAKLNEAIEIRNLEISSRKTKERQLDDILLEKDNMISNLTLRLENSEKYLKEKITEMVSLEKQLYETRKTKYDLLANILKKITDISDNFYTDYHVTGDILDSMKIYEQILLSLDKLGNHITFINLKNVDDDTNKITEILNEAKNEITELTHKNLSLEEKISEIEKINNELLFETEQNQDNNKNLSNYLRGSQVVLQDLQAELKEKASELALMEDKVKDWKYQFEDLDDIMKKQISEMKEENENLKSRIEDHKKEATLSVAVYNDQDTHIAGNEGLATSTRVSDTTNADTNSPPSLLTICCNKIVDFIEPKDSESKTTTNSSVEVENQPEISNCKCNYLQTELALAREENSRIIDLLAQMEVVNQHLLQEQDVFRSEIQLLVELVQELQKKIANHRTNLSILTATTYAENKSLKSQVKVLQHHHKRFHNVCQRDIPDFKKQLSSLMLLLKGDPTACDQQNVSFKRYSLPDVLDSSTALTNFKNESLDSDLLMLDTNITLTTAADNTLMGHDQTCLDMTQFYTEASCQTNDLNQTTDQNIQQANIFEQINTLKEENTKLRDIVNKYSETKKIDAQKSPIKNSNHLEESHEKFNINIGHECANCQDLAQLKDSHEKLNNKLKTLVENLNDLMSQKSAIEQKYNSLVLETPSTDALVKKLSIFQKEYNGQKQEISKLNNTISIKNKELKSLQEENDTLSNQLMENISEADNLNKDLDSLKLENNQLVEKCHKLEQSTKEFVDSKKSDDMNCSQCLIKDKLILTMQSKVTNTHARLNRSLSDSDTSSRYNKICTLQSELHAGREDCKELTEDVATIKNHLERSNLSMDLDETMPEGNNYTFSKDFEVSSAQSNKCNMPDIPEERTTDIYVMDKTDCFNYYFEKTGAQKDSLNCDVKIIEVMKMLYESLITKHGNEVENLTNKLKDYEEVKSDLQNQYYSLVEKQSQVNKELEERDKKYANFATLSQIRNNINLINENLNNGTDADKTKLVNIFKESLTLLDQEFDLVSVKIFESLIDNIVNKHQTDISGIMDKYTTLQEYMETVTTELNSVNSNLIEMKNQLSAKVDEYNLLKAQKERVHEISNAVTLDIVKREKELKDTIDNGYKKLVELSVVKPEQVVSNLPLNTNINVLFELLVTQNNTSQRNKESQKEALLLEVNNLKTIVEEKQKEIDLLKSRNEKSQEVNKGVTLDLIDKDNKLQALTALYDDLNKTYKFKIEENNVNVVLTEKLSEEVKTLNAKIVDKEKSIEILENELVIQRQHSEKMAKLSEVVETAKDLQEENAKLKSLNEMINKERDSYAEELKKSGETIKKNNIDLDKMMSDILVLRESVKENSSVIENLSAEAKSLLKQNKELKEQLENKCRECSRLETNIKTFEKTAQIQTRMIMRLEKQKTEEDKILSETKQQLEELSHKFTTLQKESETWKAEVEPLRKAKSDLEMRVAELEATLEGCKSRTSLDAIADSSRRRRQSLHDSQRTFAEDKLEIGDHNGVEAVFASRPKSDDVFMDVDEYASNRSTPIRLSKGRDSLSLSRTDQSDKDDEHPSRPSSVLETRRRRQTIHDSHRNELSHTPSPHGDSDSTISQLRNRLTSCQQELEDLKEKYKELDEECETCAEYLKERDTQCARLKKEKLSLQTTITELKEKLQICNPNMSQMNASKPNVAHASVNTDEDWTNLHSLVVDRMSYDAEVEKNKKLTKTIHELRFKKQELNNTIAKMQKALEKHRSNGELEATKQELQSCKQELSQLKEKYKELDEECEICGQYLREREEQCRRLKEAKAALEAKLQELQYDASPLALTARKKRQTAHDQNRGSTLDVADAATETSDDFLSYQVERDGNSRPLTDEKHAKEVKHLKLAVERLSAQRAQLEQQLVSATSAPPAMFVATGSAIVQNQQITDVMKENQKLKKINAKLVHICKKRGKDSNRENEDPADQG